MPTDTRNLRVAIADDSVLLREGVARLLTDDGMTIVGQCGDPESLRGIVAAAHPDVALIDIRMPPTHTTEGLDVAFELSETHPNTQLMLLSQYVEARHALRMLEQSRTGFGYLLKDRITDVDDFVGAVRRVARGETVIDPEVIASMTRARPVDDPLARLTDREKEVLRSMAEGRSNSAISQACAMNVKTVETHVRSIFSKLGLEPTLDDHRRVLAVLTYLGER